MSEPLRIALVGATGLVGRSLIELCVGRADVRLTAIARREMALPPGARMEMFVAEPARWGEVIEAVRPQVLVSALGTTWKKAGKDEAAFRAVDQQLVLDTARAARIHGVERMIAVSSVGADATAKNFYLRVKGEVERDLAKAGFRRLDILRPGLLKGPRQDDVRPGERAASIASPLADLLLHGRLRQYRSIPALVVAEGILALALKATQGRFVHDNDAIRRASRSLPRIVAGESMR
ncbi:NAD(P)H-binding protein [Altererythrobacter sp. H2]|uniref:NAD(P)H-binding protein n=1 Tax=Altererythrobacter sp. H2 TaxID=3108391 RepID=UPI002B4BFC50|nr:NAD(P)H-binding protein [Altererythrobacter sp. H2]WRK96785.1 NAD(P)H-binding protein [Altererythrobacter sp. H2]